MGELNNNKGGGLFVKYGSKTDDSDIVDLFFNRDERAIDETAKKYETFIFSVCNGILRQRNDSEECVNAVYEKLWKAIPPKQPNDLKAFIACLSRTTAIDRLRTNNRSKRGANIVDSLDDYADFLATDDSVIDEIYANEFAVFLNDFLKRLPERERVCFVKRYYFNSTVDEIVKQTHIPRSTIYMILDDVKKELKEQLLKGGFLS